MSRVPTVQDWARIKQHGYRVERYVTSMSDSGWRLLDPDGADLMIGDYGHIAPTQYEAVAEALSRIDQDERLARETDATELTALPVRHIPLTPFDSPTGPAPDGTEYSPVQRRSGSKDDRIRPSASYLARIRGRWYLGTFSPQHYGWNFNEWGTSGIQLDSIEDLYEVNLEALPGS